MVKTEGSLPRLYRGALGLIGADARQGSPEVAKGDSPMESDQGRIIRLKSTRATAQESVCATNRHCHLHTNKA